MRASLLTTIAVLPILLAGCTDETPTQTTGATDPCAKITASMLSISDHENSVVLVGTSRGCIVIELYDSKAPKTVANFLRYVNEKFYDDTCFHRIIPDFVVQGGGMDKESCGQAEKDTHDPVEMETHSQLKNLRYTVAMARTPDPNSATSQFFINTVDNCFLDPPSYSSCPDKAVSPDGYAVFGKVIFGLDAVEALESKGSRSGTPTSLEHIITARTMSAH